MSEHQEQAGRLERELEEMEERSERLGDEISDVREDWEAKRRDESVAGASPPEGALPMEPNVTTSGGEPSQDGENELPPPEPDETD